jgi:hypothetical protein
MRPTPQDIQLMSKHCVLSFKPQRRLEWRGQDGQNETEQPDHSASLSDSITSSTRIRFSVHTTMPQGMTRPIGVKPEGSKVDRMAAQSAKIEAGHVHLPNSAPWLGEFLTELCHFQTVVTMIRSIAFLSSADGCRTIRIICSPLSRRSSSPDRENFLSMLAPRIGHHSMIRLE